MATNYTLRGIAVVGFVAAVSAASFTLPPGVAYGSGGEARMARVDDPQWKQECGSCHVPYPPSLLPKASWRRIMAGLGNHFGENAELDPATSAHILALLEAHAADSGYSRLGAKVMRGIDGSTPPARITETAWFQRKHDEVPTGAWKRASVGSPANCGACHGEAERGIFDEHTVKIPR